RFSIDGESDPVVWRENLPAMGPGADSDEAKRTMKSRRLWPRFVILSVCCALVPGMASPAQERELAFEQIVGHPRGLPQLPPQGAWGEIINVTSRWVVIQNHSGQQYPIAVEDLGEFLIRWPSSLDALTPRSIVEAVGHDLGSNVVQTAHIDVFEGAD